MGFSKIYGNEPVKKSLIKAIREQRISNAYVFEGINGVGKRLCADVFACALVCKEKNAPCGECRNCSMAKSNNHPDIIHLLRDESKASIGVDEIREKILKEVYLKPYFANRRVFIIGEGDYLSIEAQNALLKVLEEPPENVLFIICVTKQDRLLDTVLSRSQVLSFCPLSYEEVFSYLEKYHGNAKNKDIASRLSLGSIGSAVSIISDENSGTLFEESIHYLNLLKKDASKISECTQFLIQEKENIDKVIDYMLIFIRDCVFIKTDLERNVVYKNKLSEMKVFCENISKKSLVKSFERLTDFRLRLKQNLNYNASAAETVMRIWEDFHDKSCGHKI